jgi:hypothetical protein
MPNKQKDRIEILRSQLLVYDLISVPGTSLILGAIDITPYTNANLNNKSC